MSTSIPTRHTGPSVCASTNDASKTTSGILLLGGVSSNIALGLIGQLVSEVLSIDSSWGIVAVSGIGPDRSNSKALVAYRKLNDFELKYVLLERSDTGDRCNLMTPLMETLLARQNPNSVYAQIADPSIRLIGLTITEPAYRYTPGHQLNLANADIVHDLQVQTAPNTVYGYLAKGLKLRSLNGGSPVTIVAFENIERNGDALKAALLAFVDASGDHQLEAWIKSNVAFPNCMVDRICGEPNDEVSRQVQEVFQQDAWIVKTEPYRHLVIEASPYTMPPWDAIAGVEVVDDIGPYWTRKFFGVNGAHQVPGIIGSALAEKLIDQSMRHSSVKGLLRLWHEEVGLAIDDDEMWQYAQKINRRFSDSALGDTTSRVCRDLSRKISPRILALYELAAARGKKNLRAPVFLTAVWLVMLSGKNQYEQETGLEDSGRNLIMRDDMVREWVQSTGIETYAPHKLRLLLAFIGKQLSDERFARLSGDDEFVSRLSLCLSDIDEVGVEPAIARLLSRPVS